MKRRTFIIAILLFLSPSLMAQWAVPALSVSGISNNAKWNNQKFPSYGYSLAFETLFLFATTASYNHVEGEIETPVQGGIMHQKITQNYFKYLVGYAFPIPLSKKKETALVVSGQYGFLSGSDRLNVYHEYPNGTISYGMDKTYTGVYTTIRSLASILNVKAAYMGEGKIPMFLFFGAEKVFKKKRDLSYFWDQNAVKYSYLAVNGGGGSDHAGVNDINGWNFHLGIGIILKKSNK